MPRLPDTVRDAPKHGATSRQMPLPFPTAEDVAAVDTATAAVERAVQHARHRHGDTVELARLGAELVKIMGRAR